MLLKSLSYECSLRSPSACKELNSWEFIIKWITPMIVKECERWMIWGWSGTQEQIALVERYLGFYCFIMGTLFDDHLYISAFISGAVYIFESLEIQFDMCQLPKSACVIFLTPFISCGSSLDMGHKKIRNYRFFHFFFLLIGNRKSLRLYSDTDTASPLVSWAVNWILRFFPLREEENWKLQRYRCSHRR